ncbi:MAG: hypothetical protein GWP04_00745 [Gammaproteobacteria bacterium]|nr:hypothetical protein [Gammaproteobacteria bacterium]
MIESDEWRHPAPPAQAVRTLSGLVVSAVRIAPSMSDAPTSPSGALGPERPTGLGGVLTTV